MREILVSTIQPGPPVKIDPFGGHSDRALAREKINNNIDMAIGLLSQAGESGPDIVCYTEDVQGIAHYGYYLADLELFTGFIETIPGPTTERLSAVARKYSMNIVFGIFEKLNDEFYNTAVLMGRNGEILGKYHKVHLPASERWGVRRGNGFPVFETDFGTVGMLICYDLMFPEPARALVLNGAEILLNPTMGYATSMQCADNGLVRARSRALDNMVPLAISISGSGSMIISSDGSVLTEVPPGQVGVASATLDLDGTPMDYSQWEVITGTADLKARYIQERVPEAYGDITNPHPPILDRYKEEGKRLRKTPEENWEAFEEIRRRWSGAS